MSEAQHYRIIFGGWYQRTTLHLTEIYDFFKQGISHPQLNIEKLKSLKTNLKLKSISREAGNFEYVLATTEDGITIRYYEDGLYVLEISSPDILQAKQILTNYYHSNLEPAISYIFSLGAPLPKIMASIQVTHPIVVSYENSSTKKWQPDSSLYGQIYSQISADNITVYKTGEFIFITHPHNSKFPIIELMEMQIFFREFKDQLSKYLEIHRHIWEDIEEIKERKNLKGQEIAPLRSQLDSYQKTINLISSRINQMGAYINTRKSISHELELEIHLKSLFQYKFEVLSDTLLYIKEIWTMTSHYLTSGISILRDLETQATTNSIRSLQIITSIGVVTSVLTYLTKTDFPKLTGTGLVYFIVLVIFTYLINYVVGLYYKNQRYPLKFTEPAQKI